MVQRFRAVNVEPFISSTHLEAGLSEARTPRPSWIPTATIMLLFLAQVFRHVLI